MPTRKTTIPTKPTTPKTSGKKITIPATPKQAQLDQWVTATELPDPLAKPPGTGVAPASQNPIDSPKMKRLTLDIPEDLHRSIKLKAVTQGVSMVDLLRTLLEENYRNP
jgi:hypothetical protein